jgi:HemY protein
MRIALWLLGLGAAAVALALAVGTNPGSVTLFWPPHRLDMSLNLAVLLALLVFMLAWGGARAVAALLSLPVQARAWRRQRTERALLHALADAHTQLAAGRFVRSRNAAEQVLRLHALLAGAPGVPTPSVQVRVAARLAAAEAAHALQDKARRDDHWQQAQTGLSGSTDQIWLDALRLRAARWRVEDREPAQALALLDSLSQGAVRRTQALRLRLQIHQALGEPVAALDTARLLRKHRAFAGSSGDVIVRTLVLETLALARAPQQLQAAWEALDPAERQWREVALLAAERWLGLGGNGVQATQWLSPVWDECLRQPAQWTASQRSRLVNALALACSRGVQALSVGAEDFSPGSADSANLDAPDPPGSPQREMLSTWLLRCEQAVLQYPQVGEFHFLAAAVCRELQLWGKAQQWLATSVVGLGATHPMRPVALTWLAELAEQRGDHAAALQHWRDAARAQPAALLGS